MDKKNISLEQSLQAYRVMNTPTTLSWKQHWAQEVFTSNDLLECDVDEQEQFSKRLKECAITIFDKVKTNDGKFGHACTLESLVNLVHNPINKNVEKEHRRIVYGTSDGRRPSGSEAFLMWNGFQVIDMDIKDEEIAKNLKSHIFNRLYKCNWFLGVTLSSSGNGLHIYTKISVPQNDEEDINKKKLLFYTNFRHKYSFVYIACTSAMDELGFTKEDLISWMDVSMCRPQQGAYIPYDEHPLINTHFFEDFIYVNFDNVEDLGHPDVDWVSCPDLKEVFKRWEWFNEEGDQININVLDKPLPVVDVHNKIHYKHFERWRLANTLVCLYDYDTGVKLMRQICSNNIKDMEIQADCKTAAHHKKPVDPWAVNRLNSQHGFKIKLDIKTDDVEATDLYKSIDKIGNPTLIKESSILKTYHLTKDQYLGDILHQLLNDTGRITLIEAGAGVGKTEMVKKLVREGKKVMMVMPFTSTIKSKVENDPDWTFSYGSKQPKLDTPGGLSLTIDKFSKLNLMDVKANGFDYIFIDESHLMFQSEYRPVMPKVIDMIKNTEVPIILMSGTPSGEIVFIPDIVHLKITKDDIRKKEFKVNMVENTSDLLFHMCRNMAKDISEGKRILFPTNEGTLYSKRIQAGVTFFMQNDYQDFNEVKLKYYKKSNLGEEFMNKVNFEKTIADTQILLCTNYLSVGVDILDKYNFAIYFGDLFMPQEVEQFANRLRSNDLYINLYIAKNDSDGKPRFINKYKEMNLTLNEDELRDGEAILELCNKKLKRNSMEYRYNTLISSMLNGNKFVEYNKTENKYYLNKIAYKVTYFERKYREYVQQLPVLMRGMQAYGYQINSEDLKNPNSEGAIIFKDLKNMVKLAHDEQLALNTKHIEELMDIITDDRLEIYKDALAGKYEILKGKDWSDDADKHIMVVKNIEAFEKVVPIFISMSKTFEIKVIKDIFEYCRNKNNTFNFAAINRIRMLINILYNDKHNRLDIPIKVFMNESYDFSDRLTVHKNEITNFVNSFAERYASHESSEGILIQESKITMKTMQDIFMKIFKCLVNVSRPTKKGMVEMHRVEMLWKERERYLNENLNDKLFILTDFLNLSKEQEENKDPKD